MEKKVQEQIYLVCEHILANASQIDTPEVLAAARELLKAATVGTKDGFTSEGLANAIRCATGLLDLKHLVGPTPEDNELAARRLDKIDAIWNRNEKAYGCETGLWPFHEKDTYDRLMAEQGEYERTYC